MHNDSISVYIAKWSLQCLINIHYHTQLQIFFLWWVFKIHSLSNFRLYSIELLAIVTMLYITSPGLVLYLEVCTFWLSSPISPTAYSHYSPPQATTNPFSLCLFLASGEGVEVQLTCNIILVLGVQHNDLIFLFTVKRSLWCH